MSSQELGNYAEGSGPTFKQWARKQVQPCEIIKWLISILLVILFMCCWIVVFSVFKTEDDGNRSAQTFDDGIVNSNLPRMNCTLGLERLEYGIGVTLSLDCTRGLPAQIVDQSGLYLQQQLNVVVNRRSFTFPAGTIPAIISIPVYFEDGSLQVRHLWNKERERERERERDRRVVHVLTTRCRACTVLSFRHVPSDL